MINRNIVRMLVSISIVTSVSCTEQGHHHPSVAELKLTENKFVGNIVSVRGFLSSQLGANRSLFLYANAEEYRMKNHRMAVYLDLSVTSLIRESCLNSYVVLEGRYDYINEDKSMSSDVQEVYVLKSIGFIGEIPESLNLPESERNRLVCYQNTQ